ncbi:Arylsulfatase [Pontiella desulfatans]|uniref:Arylsulfatase n=1 Tax=Pontiella desulfatans TaxID=2750659 RepID=A0A6C2U8Y1_PONDE|nr:sulfatase-like hydrolase/transferase [Pontiella desulfatans]SPS74027.1 sulfatase S1_24 [Kiritimatiellales bacterium]VGO16303.1 Arylsulfatase [Pontiella desulfatans]
MNRRNLLRSGALLATAAALPAARAAKPRQPNIVLIMLDDVSPEMYGCYGSKDAKTPNIDRWSKEGVMFRTAWGSAVCTPSRALIMTGRYATTTGFWYNGFAVPQKDGTNDLFKHHHSFGKLMQQEGYATAVVGKWHVGSAEAPHHKHVGFDEYCLWEGPKELGQLPDKPEHTGLWEDEKTPSRYWDPCFVINGNYRPPNKGDFGPDISVDFLNGFMERKVKEDKPFLAYWACVAPHGTRKGSPTCPIYGKPGTMDKDKADDRNRFRALNDYIDILVGKVEQKVNELGIADNTVFIICSDNGTASIAKSRGVERGCHVLFIAKGAGVKQRGTTDELTDFSDILPTLLDYAGGTPPENYELHGQSLKPFLSGASDAHRDYIFACTGTSQLMRTKTHMLEVVNPILDVPDGRFYYCGNHRFGKGYKRVDNDPEHASQRAYFEKTMAKYPNITNEHPYFQDQRAADWLTGWKDPRAAGKHLHNHKDFQFYDEALDRD